VTFFAFRRSPTFAGHLNRRSLGAIVSYRIDVGDYRSIGDRTGGRVDDGLMGLAGQKVQMPHDCGSEFRRKEVIAHRVILCLVPQRRYGSPRTTPSPAPAGIRMRWYWWSLEICQRAHRSKLFAHRCSGCHYHKPMLRCDRAGTVHWNWHCGGFAALGYVAE